MRRALFLFFSIVFSLSIYAQIDGPPPPCGYTPGYSCNSDGSNFAIFNLREIYPFTFCAEVSQSDYHPVTYYETEEDRDNETNPIANPESYLNLTNPQTIYYRANKINPTGNIHNVLRSANAISVAYVPEISKPTPLIVCDTNNNGIGEFILSSKNSEILAGLNSNIYNVSYHETPSDAQNNANRILSPYENITNPQSVYARVAPNNSSNCSEIVELDLVVQDICVDVAVYLTSVAPPRPGFDYIYYLTVKNIVFDAIASGQVQFTYDSSLSFIEVTGVDSGNSISNTASGFILNFTDLMPNTEERIYIRMNTPISTSLGTLLTSEAIYLDSDINTESNLSSLSEVVIGSYDPNDILESHGPEILHSSFGSEDYLYYTIRFQNVGTADAINVSIDNTLDSRLDKSTIQMLSSSHANVFTRTNNQLNWQFDDIYLPSEDMDEPNSHGYVHYKIKPLAGYSVGDIIPNTAEIYFDFNPAVITNTFETEFTTTLSNTEINSSVFSIYPNPTRSFIELNFGKGINKTIKINIYDIQGKRVFDKTNEVEDASLKIDVSQLTKGMYFLKVDDGTSKTTKKLIVK